MAPRVAVTARGALAGAVAAWVWAAQQPVDMRLFRVPYDDAELLATALPTGRWTTPLGWVLHGVNGAAFGAIYANVAPRIPGPAWARGPVAGMVEHAATWPATALIPRLHPDAGRFPPLWGSRRALAQATWRHLLFGGVLGALEGRLNRARPAPPVAPAAPVAVPATEDEPVEAVVSVNGHGDARAPGSS